MPEKQPASNDINPLAKFFWSRFFLYFSGICIGFGISRASEKGYALFLFIYSIIIMTVFCFTLLDHFRTCKSSLALREKTQADSAPAGGTKLVKVMFDSGDGKGPHETPMTGAEIDTLTALVNRGPLGDGDVPSKAGRDSLVKRGFADRTIIDGVSLTYATHKGHVLAAARNKRPDKSQTPFYQDLMACVGELESAGHRLALELECLLMDTKDMPTVSKWWEPAMSALEVWRDLHQGCGACGDGCKDRGACRVDDENPVHVENNFDN
jgi:Kef-type K+ transport system membrane component KefB